MSKRLPVICWLALLAASASWVPSVHADAPALLPIQGYLTDAAGLLLTDGTYTIRFRLYDAATAGTTLHDDTLDVSVVKGYFTVYLGDTLNSGSALDLAKFRDNATVFLGIKIGADPEASPRLQFATTAFAAVANYCGDAKTVGGKAPSDFAAVSHTHDISTLTGSLPYSSLSSVPATFAPTAHMHAASDISSGTLSTALYSAYTDLSSEGYLDNNAGTDLLTQSQGDSRYAMQSALSATGTLNNGNNPVDWTKLKSVPAGFADNVDNDSGGDITDITTSPGSGLAGGCGSGNCSLSVPPGGISAPMLNLDRGGDNATQGRGVLLGGGDNAIFLPNAPLFKATSNGVCLVTVSGTTDSAPATGYGLGDSYKLYVAVGTGGSTVPGWNTRMPFMYGAPAVGNQMVGAAVTSVQQISAGNAYQFGCGVLAQGNMKGQNFLCSVSYICL